MTPADDFMNEAEHPALLPWYAAGTLDAWTARRIEEHLEACAACRLEQEQLASMSRTLRRGEGGSHVGVLDLVEFASGEAATGGETERGDAVRRHLAECAACRDEVETVRQARPRVGSESAGETRSAEALRWRRAFLVAAAAAALLLVPATRALLPGRAVETPREVHPVRLLAQTRGGEEAAVLSGSGPWIVEVILPFGAPTGPYTVHLESPGGASRPVETRAQPNAEGILSLLLPGLSRAGSYAITVAPVAPTGKSYRYAFTRSESP
jgi:anti-sigma factor RsiW